MTLLALQTRSDLCIPRNETLRPRSQFPHSCTFVHICERFIHIFPQSVRGTRPRSLISENICYTFSVYCVCRASPQNDGIFWGTRHLSLFFSQNGGDTHGTYIVEALCHEADVGGTLLLLLLQPGLTQELPRDISIIATLQYLSCREACRDSG